MTRLLCSITRLLRPVRPMIDPRLYDVAGSYEGACKIRARKSAEMALYLRARRSFPDERSWHRKQHFYWKAKAEARARRIEERTELDCEYSYARKGDG